MTGSKSGIVRFGKPVMDALALGLFGRRPETPAQRDVELIERLRDRFREITQNHASETSPAAQRWADNVRRLAACVRDRDPRAFLRWPVVQETMFAGTGRTAWTEWNALRKHPDWSGRWSQAIVETPLGRPLPFLPYPRSSGNLIHHAYHLMQFEECAGTHLHEFDAVFEFGGGYGAMCRLWHNLGFEGRYTIFDLPAFSALQEYYLSGVGLGANGAEDADGRIRCLSQWEELHRVVGHCAGGRGLRAMFLATWSFSEAPLHIRDAIIPLLSECEAFLIAYQARFGEVDNVKYFTTFRDRFPYMEWKNWEIRHMPGNYYLMGSRSRGPGQV